MSVHAWVLVLVRARVSVSMGMLVCMCGMFVCVLCIYLWGFKGAGVMYKCVNVLYVFLRK